MKRFALLLSAFLLVLSPAREVFAYDEHTTHPALTQEIIDFYNRSYPNDQLTPEEAKLVIKGSMLEDTAPRWINHFYDPVHNVGWTGEKAGSIPPQVVLLLTAIGVSSDKPLSALEWINDYGTQEDYAAYGGNHTWKRGMEYFADGDTENAYLTLGHDLHLLEDMAVPDHTRNDTHIHELGGLTGDEGSPYELYAMRWTQSTIGQLQIPAALMAQGAKPIEKISIADYLIDMATYSNHYFFSKDTINDPKYEYPKITREDDTFAYGKDENGVEFPLAKESQKWNESSKSYNNNLDLLNKPIYESILDAYFSRLAKRVIQEGAGAIALWKSQAGDAAVNKEFPQHLYTIDPRVVHALHGNNFSFVGMVAGLTRVVSTAISNLFSHPSTDVTQGLATSTLPSGNLRNPTHISREPSVLSESTSTLDVSTSEHDVATTTATSTEPLFPVLHSNPGAMGKDYPQEATSTAVSTNTGSGDSGTGSSGSNASDTDSTSTTPHIENFRVSYLQSALEIHFSWDAVTPAGTSTPAYKLYKVSNSLDGITETTSTTAIYKITEIGRTYNFELRADPGDRTVRRATASIAIPSFLSGLAFYPNPLGGYLIDIQYAARPFIPPVFKGTPFWQGLVFYLNREANAGNTMLETPTNFQPADTAGALPLDRRTGNYTTIFAILPEFATGVGGGLSNSAGLLPSEDNHFLLPADRETPPGEGDYLTIGYYDFARSGAGNQELDLVATDATHYQFQTASPQLPPTTPGNLAGAFDAPNMKVNLTWATSTDPDSPDANIHYQIALGATNDFSSVIWTDVGKVLQGSLAVTYPNPYTLAVRALDEFGNASVPATLDWQFPSDFHPASTLTGTFSNSAFPNGYCGFTAGEPITPTGEIKVTRVTYYAMCSNGRCDPANDFMISDESGALLAVTNGNSTAFGYPTPAQVTQTFSTDNQITLHAGTTYRVAPRSSQGQCSVDNTNSPQNTFTFEGELP